jgi:hypothetical protein
VHVNRPPHIVFWFTCICGLKVVDVNQIFSSFALSTHDDVLRWLAHRKKAPHQTKNSCFLFGCSTFFYSYKKRKAQNDPYITRSTFMKRSTNHPRYQRCIWKKKKKMRQVPPSTLVVVGVVAALLFAITIATNSSGTFMMVNGFTTMSQAHGNSRTRPSTSAVAATTSDTTSDTDSSTTSRSRSLLCRNTTRQSCLEIVEPRTGCHVSLIGCFHGSSSSAIDVQTVLSQQQQYVDVVVLELCTSRFAQLRNDMIRQQQQEQQQQQEEEEEVVDFDSNIRTLPTPQRQRSWSIRRWMTSVQHMIQRQGVSTGMAAAIVGGVAGLQTTLSGLQPGIEFRTAVQYVQQQQQNTSTTSITDAVPASTGTYIVLADQNVEDTLAQVGKLPHIAAALWQTCWREGWDTSFGREATALQRALFGGDTTDNTDHDNHDDDPPRSTTGTGTGTGTTTTTRLDIRRFCTRSPTAVRDLIRLVVPPIVLTQVVTVLLPTLFHFVSTSFLSIMREKGDTMVPPLLPSAMMMDTTATTSLTTTTTTTPTTTDLLVAASSSSSESSIETTIVLVVLNALLLAMGYLSIALPAVQVILRQRDDRLTEGIQQACIVAAATTTTTSRNKSMSPHTRHNNKDDDDDDNDLADSSRPGRVVAVLGLLHVNGIADRLLQEPPQEQNITTFINT